MREWIIQLQKALPKLSLRTDVPMRELTSFHIGGPVDVLAEPDSAESCAALLAYIQKQKLPYFVMGKGSNLLVGDGGIRGVMIRIRDNMKQIRVDDRLLIAEAGASIEAVSYRAALEGLSGLEFACGIPGCVGGAVMMNAGAYEGEMKQVLHSVLAMDENGEIHELGLSELELSYRHSIFTDKKWVILEAGFLLKPSARGEILERMAELTRKREEKQPLEWPSVGSFFKRPVGYFTGKLIMDAGLCGFRIGDVQVSEKHCGFLINVGEATAADVIRLRDEIIRIIKEKNGVTLEPEVKMIGEFK
ncbi:MAG: UDP-N-acetylmuramate dehydrogenase [Lachnospiraceae bacterium]|nr:UDP-N-acetylmuramate dehydrogenase [Lachnospiraceae bacterium]MDY5741757.1 UDP-N-acetylmuramate dehydrogenase [Lachnospiraceae bacterium]